MGLAVVHGIVLGCGGKIHVESTMGKGTSFIIFLPCAEVERFVKDESPTGEILSGAERILFVDDDKDIVELAEEYLTELGYDVTSALSGTDALAVFSENPDVFDLVITDLTMPEMSGEQLAGAVHRIRPDIPLILCTGYNTYLPDQKAREAGIKDILIKPVPSGDMAEAIRSVLDSAANSGPLDPRPFINQT